MAQNSKAWLTLDEIAETVAGEYRTAPGLFFQIDGELSHMIAARIATASRDKARRLQEQDPMSRFGTSAAEASKAFQGLQEATKDLVDLEIVVHGSGEGLREVVAAEAQKVQDATLQQKLGGPRIQTITMAESVSRLAPEVHREMLRAMQEPAPAPWYKRSLSWFLCIPEPLTDEQMEEAVEGLERALRLPWYKRLPAFIAWTWRLP